jgi:AraC-like DNA-binding protein
MELKRGSIYLLAPGNFHKIIMSPELKIVNVMFDESIISRELLSKLRDNHSNISAILSDRELSEAYDLAKGIMNELKEPDPHSALYAKNLLNCLIVKLIRNSGSYSSSTDSQRYDPINRALHYLYENYRDNPTIDRVATVCGYTPNYFSKLFVDLTGKCYTDFLNSLKISYAKVLLRSDEYNVSEIAFASGFTSLSNFYRVFKADVGIAPLDYRKTR